MKRETKIASDHWVEEKREVSSAVYREQLLGLERGQEVVSLKHLTTPTCRVRGQLSVLTPEVTPITSW